MKKYLALALLASLTLSAFGQGQVRFTNKSTTGGIDARVYIDLIGGAMPTGANTMYRAALLGGAVGSTATSLDGLGTLQMLASPNTGKTWVNFRTDTGFEGVVAVGSDGARVVNGVNYGSPAVFQVVAWEGNYTTWADAYAAGKAGQIKIGFSNVITVNTSTSLTDPNVPFLTGLQPFAIAIVPEPSSMALAGLGAAALLIFRRRK